MNRFLVLSFLFLLYTTAGAQTVTVGGTVRDSTRQPIIGANVQLVPVADSTHVLGAVTDRTGSFSVHDVAPAAYRLKITYLGYTTLNRTVRITADTKSLGTFTLTTNPIELQPVDVVEVVPAVEEKQDTVEYNARAYKTNPDATVEDLAAKMPGIAVDKNTGTVTAQGQQVQKVLVDGRQFFGDDPTMAMRNLPADVVDRIQVFDKLSDQAQLTGFDDGQAQKTMNIITKITRRNGVFGRLYAGYGTESTYQAGASVNYFNDAQRVSFLGMSNNINQQNFSFQDILGLAGIGSIPRRFSGMAQMGMRMLGQSGGGRSGSFFSRLGGGSIGDFFVGQQNGISTTHSAGVNFSDEWAQNLEVNGSYFYNMSRNHGDNRLTRQYFLTGDTSQFYDERNRNSSDNQNHRFNFRMEWTADTLNTLIEQPRVTVQTNSSTTNLDGTNTYASLPLSSTSSLTNADVSGYTLSNALVFRHRFFTPGRSISASLNASRNDRTGTNSLDSRDAFYTGAIASFDSLDQKADTRTNGYALSGNLAYTEPLGSNGLLQASYSAAYTKSDNDKRTYDRDSLTQLYTLQVPELSNVLTSGYLTHAVGAGYRVNVDDWNAFFTVDYQIASLTGTQTLPSGLDISRRFYNVLPMANIRWRPSNRENVMLMYRSSTSPPSVTQLQQVVDNSNPLQLSTGNPDLRQDFTHTLIARFMLSSEDRTDNLFGFAYAGFTDNYIGTTTVLANSDTTVLGGIPLPRGAQISYPVNVDGYRTYRALLTYNFPFKLIESNVNLNAGVSYVRSPGAINGQSNIATTVGWSPGLIVSSNVSENLDFTLSYLATLNTVHNTLSPELNNDYFTHSASARLSWTFWDEFVLRSDVTHILYHGLGAGYDQDNILWNASIAKKFLGDNRGELALSVYDLLNRNESVYRDVTESYIEDQRPLVLKQYFQLTFTYTLRSFNAPAEFPGRGRDHEHEGGRGGMFPPMR